MTSSATLYLLLPEIILVLVATAIYVGGAFTAAREGWSWLAAAGLLLAGLALHQQQDALHASAAVAKSAAAPAAANVDPAASAGPATGATAAAEGADDALLSGPVVIDLFTHTTRWFVIGVGLLLVLILARSAATGLAPEMMGSLLLMMAGLMFVAEANDLVLMFLGLELVSIPTYVVLYLGRNDTASQEAAMKYFFLSILSSALLLYGFSFLYGFRHTTNLIDASRAVDAATLHAQGMSKFALLAIVLIFAGLGFRLTAVPFHFYAPDVYQGTSHANAALLSVVPKIAGLVALVRVLAAPIVAVDLPSLARVGWQMSLVLAVLTMTVGNLLALWQQNLRRMLAYSSIAHAGYMLIGVAVAFAASIDAAEAGPAARGFMGVGATMFYLATYVLATVGAFAALAYLSGEERQLNTLDELAGVARSHPAVAASMAVCMFSLMGLPPLAGFWGKLVLINGALSFAPGEFRWWLIALSVVTMINAAVSAGYYLRVVSAMYFRESVHVVRPQGGPALGAAMLVSTLGVLLVGLAPDLWVEVSQRAGAAAQASVSRHSVEAQIAGAASPSRADAAVPSHVAAVAVPSHGAGHSRDAALADGENRAAAPTSLTDRGQ